MLIWHLTPYDTIPGEAWRPGRAITMSRVLAAAGHEVIWWTSNYSHFFKRHRSSTWQDIPAADGLTVRLVPVPGYDGHISLARLDFHRAYAQRMLQRARHDPPPDAIIFATPAPFADVAAARLARRTGAKLVVDIRDTWPELFEMAIPGLLRPLAPVLLWPFYAMRQAAFKQADAVTAVTRSYLDVATPHANAVPTEVIYFGADVDRLRQLMKQPVDVPILPKTPGDVWAIYAGTLGDNYDIRTVLQAARRLRSTLPHLKFIIAGDGPLRSYLVDFIEEHALTNVQYVGLLSYEVLAHYYGASDIGLSPYHPDSTVAMPAKIYDYLAAGLPVINSLPGDLAVLIEEQSLGLDYTAGDVESLVRALTSLTTDPTLQARMAENASRIAPQFDRQIQYQKFVEIVAAL